MKYNIVFFNLQTYFQKELVSLTYKNYSISQRFVFIKGTAMQMEKDQ